MFPSPRFYLSLRLRSRGLSYLAIQLFRLMRHPSKAAWGRFELKSRSVTRVLPYQERKYCG